MARLAGDDDADPLQPVDRFAARAVGRFDEQSAADSDLPLRMQVVVLPLPAEFTGGVRVADIASDADPPPFHNQPLLLVRSGVVILLGKSSILRGVILIVTDRAPGIPPSQRRDRRQNQNGEPHQNLDDECESDFVTAS